jgi:hypothetical protein
MNIKKTICSIIGHKKTVNGFPTTVCPRCGHVLIHLTDYPTDNDVKKRKMKLDPPVPSPARRDEQNNSSTHNAEQVDNNALNMALYHIMLHSDTLDGNQNHTDSNTTQQSDSNSDSYRNDYDSGGSSYDNSSSNGYYDSGYSSSDSTSTSWDY